MASVDDDAGVYPDVEAPPYSYSSFTSDTADLDEETVLRKAARAGILLLEANQELQEENAALRTQVTVLENERPSLKDAIEARDAEIARLKVERKQCLVEVNSLRNELKATSAMVTDSLEREHHLKTAVEEAQALKIVAETELENLLAEYKQLQLKEVETAETSTKEEYVELMQKWHATSEENEGLQLELKSLRKQVDSLRRKAAKVPEYLTHIERLEKKNAKLQMSNDTLHEELTEERALVESTRAMNLMYKKIADSRPFSTACTCTQHPNVVEHTLGVSVQDVLLDTNMKLETELRALRIALNLKPTSTTAVLEEQYQNNRRVDEDDGGDLKQPIRRGSSNYSLSVCSDTTYCDSNGDGDAVHENLLRKVQDLQEKLRVAKEMLKHTKLQWSAAVASQKALEECNQSAQAEITRLTQQLDYQISAMASQETGASPPTKRTNRGSFSADDEEKWMEETAPYPAPPGDLNSPLIKCLLDHWTTDKSKIMMLTDWLHHAIRGTGKPTPLRLESLSSEVAAGFAQLLVPIMRERHGVSVTIYRRDSVHILSDLVLQTNQPSTVVQSYSTTTTPTKVSILLPDSCISDHNGMSNMSDEGITQGREHESQFLKGEAQFLYG